MGEDKDKSEKYFALSLGDEVELRLTQTKRYKSVRIDLFIITDLTLLVKSFNTLIGRLFECGTSKYSSMSALNNRFEELFGTHFTSNVTCLAGKHLLQLSLDVLDSDQCARLGGEDTVPDAFKLLTEILCQPKLSGGTYSEFIVSRETEIIKANLESLRNDKTYYAQLRCLEEMGRGTCWGMSSTGSQIDFSKINGQSLWEHHQQLLRTCPILLFINGDIAEDEALGYGNYLVRCLPNRKASKILRSRAMTDGCERQLFETHKGTQSKFVYGHYLDLPYCTTSHAHSLVFNSLWCKDSHSVLNRELREKKAICYYLDSQIDLIAGSLFTTVSCVYEDYRKICQIIDDAMFAFSQGKVSMDHLLQSKSLNISRLQSAQKDREAPIYNNLLGYITDYSIDPKLFMEIISTTRIKDIRSIAEGMKRGTSFFLYGKG